MFFSIIPILSQYVPYYYYYYLDYYTSETSRSVVDGPAGRGCLCVCAEGPRKTTILRHSSRTLPEYPLGFYWGYITLMEVYNYI